MKGEHDDTIIIGESSLKQLEENLNEFGKRAATREDAEGF